MKASLFACLFLFLFSCWAEETTTKKEIETDPSAHVFDLSSTSSSSECRRRAPTNHGTLKKKGAPVRLEVVHRDGPCAPEGSKGQLGALSSAEIFAQDQLRVDSIHAAAAAAAAAGGANTNEDDDDDEDYGPFQLPAFLGQSVSTSNYVVTVALGTPKHYLTLVIDTGSVLTWTQCEPCHPRDCYKQNEPIFNPSASRTYTRIPCTSPHCARDLGKHKRGGPSCVHHNPDCPYIVLYQSGQNSTGFYSSDKLTLSSTNVFYNFRFGCGTHNRMGTGARYAGLLGLGRGPTSFVTQTQGKYSQFFAYCLTSEASLPGFLALGGEEYYELVGGMAYTPLVHNPPFEQYHIEITAIGVSDYRLPIEDSVFTDAGAIIDSGTVVSRLPPAAYTALATAFTKKMLEFGHESAPPEEYSLDTCFYLKNGQVPKVSFYFKDAPAFDLATSGTFYHFASGKSCLAFFSNRSPAALAVFGNIQQRTFEMVYDVTNNKLGFRSNKFCE